MLHLTSLHPNRDPENSVLLVSVTRKTLYTGECDPENSDNFPSLSYAGSPVSQIETLMLARDSKTTAFSQTEAFLLFL